MAQDALERLYNTNNDDRSKYSVDEQMDSISDDDFLESMSEDSRSALLKSVQPSIQEITLDDVTNEPSATETASSITEDKSSTVEDKPTTIEDKPTTVEDDATTYIKPEEKPTIVNNEELFNNNTEDKRTHKTRKQSKQVESSPIINQSNNTFDPIMNQLALNVIDDLQSKQFKLGNFDDNLMQIVFNYMRTKF